MFVIKIKGSDSKINWITHYTVSHFLQVLQSDIYTLCVLFLMIHPEACSLDLINLIIHSDPCFNYYFRMNDIIRSHNNDLIFIGSKNLSHEVYRNVFIKRIVC